MLPVVPDNIVKLLLSIETTKVNKWKDTRKLYVLSSDWNTFTICLVFDNFTAFDLKKGHYLKLVCDMGWKWN